MSDKKIIVDGIEGFKSLEGKLLGESEWFEITQERVDLFAEATLDRQWIHTDAERASKTPFGGTIAHGYLSLSLLPYLLSTMSEVRGVTMALNYGLDKLRFPNPLPVGKRVRLKIEVISVKDVPGGVQVKLGCTMEIENIPKPALFAEILFRYFS